MPVAYDYSTLSPIYGTRSLSLAPDGREILGEIAWRAPLRAGYGSASLFYRQDPGHYADTQADAGLALRWSNRF